MQPDQEKKIESPAWQHPAPGNEQNDNAPPSANASIKTGGNSRSAEDDLDLEKQPYRDGDDAKEDLNESPEEKSSKK